MRTAIKLLCEETKVACEAQAMAVKEINEANEAEDYRDAGCLFCDFRLFNCYPCKHFSFAMVLPVILFFVCFLNDTFFVSNQSVLLKLQAISHRGPVWLYGSRSCKLHK